MHWWLFSEPNVRMEDCYDTSYVYVIYLVNIFTKTADCAVTVVH